MKTLTDEQAMFVFNLMQAQAAPYLDVMKSFQDQDAAEKAAANVPASPLAQAPDET